MICPLLAPSVTAWGAHGISGAEGRPAVPSTRRRLPPLTQSRRLSISPTTDCCRVDPIGRKSTAIRYQKRCSMTCVHAGTEVLGLPCISLTRLIIAIIKGCMPCRSGKWQWISQDRLDAASGARATVIHRSTEYTPRACSTRVQSSPLSFSHVNGTIVCTLYRTVGEGRGSRCSRRSRRSPPACWCRPGDI
jgi:hypothetical protein